MLNTNSVDIWDVATDNKSTQLKVSGCMFNQAYVLWDGWVLIRGSKNLCWNLQTQCQLALTSLDGGSFYIASVVVNAELRLCLLITSQRHVYVVY